MQVESLDELKARNAAEEAKANEAALKAKPKEEESAEANDQKPTDSEPDGQKPKEEGESAEAGDEAWMQADEASGDDKQKVIPLGEHIGMRTSLRSKLKEKDGALKERDAELEKLRQEVEALKKPVQSQQAAPVKQADDLEIPDPMDFKTTAEYKKAMNDFIANSVQKHASLSTQTQSAKQRQDEQAKRQDAAVEDHCKRAQELVANYGIAPNMYRQKEMKVREAIESVFPSAGDDITDALIESIGEGSEKVFYFLGNNEAARSTLVSKLAEDKTGVKASIYLGKILAERASASPSKSSSSAPNPATRIKGSMKAPSAEATKLKKQHDDAEKRGDIQAVFDARSAARDAGIDYKSW